MGDASLRKVLYISGTRADYGPARRMLKTIAQDNELNLSVVVTAMHLDPVHGETWQEIEKDGLVIADKIPGREPGDSLYAMAASMGNYLHGMALSFSKIKPDIVMVLGDRGEMLAAAISAAYQNIPVVHLCGGSISGSIDDSVRHAITKFSHYHLVAFQESVKRIEQMGENPANILYVGMPGGDIRPDAIFSRAEIYQEFGLDPEKPYFLVIQHAVTQTHHLAVAQVTETLEALVELGYPALLANPNDDAGGRAILATMKEYARQYKNLVILPPLANRQKFASIMAHAAVLVGNSSSAVVESMSVGLPVVNIGERQKGREQLSCWVNANHDRSAIKKAISIAMFDEEYRKSLSDFTSKNIFNDEVTNQKVVGLLKTLDLDIAKKPKGFFNI